MQNDKDTEIVHEQFDMTGEWHGVERRSGERRAQATAGAARQGGITHPESAASRAVLPMTDSQRQSIEKALEVIEAALQEAHDNAFHECCGHGVGGECCGNPEPAWSAEDQKIMNALAPAQRGLSGVVRAIATPVAGWVPEGWQLVPIEPTPKMMQEGEYAASMEYALRKSFYWVGKNAYRKMLEAAPPAPVTPKQEQS